MSQKFLLFCSILFTADEGETQSVECLPWKHEDLSSILETYIKKEAGHGGLTRTHARIFSLTCVHTHAE